MFRSDEEKKPDLLVCAMRLLLLVFGIQQANQNLLIIKSNKFLKKFNYCITQNSPAEVQYYSAFDSSFFKYLLFPNFLVSRASSFICCYQYSCFSCVLLHMD